jgi:hypothetical protein
MADSNKIEIRIEGSGGDQAAAEIRKVEAAQDALQASAEQTGTRGFGGMLDGVPERADEAAEAIKKIDAAAVPFSEHLGEAADHVEDLGDQANGANDKLDKIINIQRAQIANEIAGGLGQIGAKVREASKDFAEADPEFSKTLGDLSLGLEMASGAASGAAQGFAVGGPFGAAVGALIGGAIAPFIQAMDDMTASLARASSSEAQAAEMKRRLAEAQAGANENSFRAIEASEELRDAYNAESDAIDGITAAIRRRNEIQGAEAEADKAIRDRADDAEIRGGASPEDVKARRALDDAEAAKNKIDQDLADKNQIERAARERADAARAKQAEIEANPESTLDQIGAARGLGDTARQQADAAEQDRITAERAAVARKRAIDERAAREVENQTAQKAAREQREKDLAEREQQRKEQQAERERERVQRESNKSAGDVAGLGFDAANEARKLGNTAGADLLEKRAKALMQNPNKGDSEELLALMERMLTWAEQSGADGKGGSRLAALEKRQSILEAQLKNGRTGN